MVRNVRTRVGSEGRGGGRVRESVREGQSVKGVRGEREYHIAGNF